MAVNYRRLQKGGKAAAAVAVGIAATILAILFGNLLPAALSTTIAIGLLLLTRSCAQVLQGPAVTQHVSAGGKLGSKWAAAGIGIAVLALLFAGIFFVKWELDVADNTPKVTFGTQDAVFYSGSATKADAQLVGKKLKSIGYFTDRGANVFLSKDSGGAVVAFVVTEGSWNKPEMVNAFEEIGSQVAPLMGSPTIKVRMINTTRATKMEMTAGEVIVGTKDEVFYSGSATEADAKALGQALITAGYLVDNGTNVLLSQGEGTVISLVVNKGIWEKPENVVPIEDTIRKVASSVGGLPIKLRLLSPELVPKGEVTVQ